jgi:hypothetical protein
MVLSPLVFKTFAILIEKPFARLVVADCFGGGGQQLFGTSSIDGYPIELGHCRCGKSALLAGSWMEAENRTNFPSGVKVDGILLPSGW